MHSRDFSNLFFTVSQKHIDKHYYRPPLILWGDIHDSPLNYDGLNSLVPFLDEHGYNCFGLENDYTLDYQATAKLLENYLKHSNKILNQFAKVKQPILKEHAKLISDSEKDVLAKTQLNLLLEKTNQTGWDYQGLDLPSSENKEENNFLGSKLHKSSESMGEQITKSYLKDEKGMVAIMGIAHVIEVCELLARSLEYNKATILFINIAKSNVDISNHLETIRWKFKKLDKVNGINFKCKMFEPGENTENEIKKFIQENMGVRLIKSIAIKKLNIAQKTEEKNIFKEMPRIRMKK